MVSRQQEQGLLGPLTHVRSLNNQAIQEMRSRRYTSAANHFSEALQRSKLELARCNGLPQDPIDGMTVSVELGVAWNEALSNEQRENQSELVFQQPLLLHIHHDEEGPSTTDDEIFRILCFGMIVNLALCHHTVALSLQQRGVESSRYGLALGKTMQLYQLAGMMFSAVQERQAPLQLILLNNLGEAFLHVASLGQAIHCFQSLASAMEIFRSGNYVYTTRDPMDMEALVDHFHSQRHARLPLTSSCASTA